MSRRHAQNAAAAAAEEVLHLRPRNPPPPPAAAAAGLRVLPAAPPAGSGDGSGGGNGRARAEGGGDGPAGDAPAGDEPARADHVWLLEGRLTWDEFATMSCRYARRAVFLACRVHAALCVHVQA